MPNTPQQPTQGATALNDEQRRLAERHLPFAQHMAQHYGAMARSKGISMDDLQQDAALGLCEAALRYDPAKGVSFRTYAYAWCYKYIMRTLLNEPLSSCGVECVADLDDVDISDEEASACLLRRVESLLSCLTQREQRIVSMLHGIGTQPHTMGEIARHLHLSLRLVTATYRTAVRKMKQRRGA